VSNPISKIDPEGLLEYSVVFTDRSLNHMSMSFQGIMRDISTTLKKAYNANASAIIPGGGTYAMEAVARQFSSDKKILVIRNGWFSYRWTQIFDMGKIPASSTVLKARPVTSGSQAAFTPAPIDEVVKAINAEKPDFVFAAHVETSSGIILPDNYMKSVAEAVHANGGMFVLDCIASGTIWVDMKDISVDILISAPQKGWSASPCGGLVMFNETARAAIDGTQSTSFAMDLKKWLSIMEAYENGGHAYHATLPTDAIVKFHTAMKETETFGFAEVKEAQQELGNKVRALLGQKQYRSVAAAGFEAPSVVVYHTDDADIHSGKKFAALGMQIAAGVPLQCNEHADYKTFRMGLFGLDKLKNIDRTLANLDKVLTEIL
jgi:aspartate aminotransferase-like enzyme